MVAPNVFLDANVIIGAGKPPGGPQLSRVRDLAKAGLIKILSTDWTMVEVAKKHAKNDFDVVKDITQPHFRRIAQDATGLKLPEMKKAELRDKLSGIHTASTAELFKSLKAKMLNVDGVKPSVIFEMYSSGTGFFSSEGKKDQFPDAFIFEALKSEASADQHVIVVSEDKDFHGPIGTEEHMSLVSSLPKLFEALGLEIDAPEVEGFIEEQETELLSLLNSELNDWGLIGDVDDSDIDEITVLGVEVQEFSAFKSTSKGDPILVVGKLAVSTQVSYSHPDWDNAMYDSEDKVLIPFDTVTGEAELDIDIDVSISIMIDDDGDPVAIESLEFNNNDFQYVTLHPNDGWPYK